MIPGTYTELPTFPPFLSLVQGSERPKQSGEHTLNGLKMQGHAALMLEKKDISAVGRIRTYAPRGNLISSQTP